MRLSPEQDKKFLKAAHDQLNDDIRKAHQSVFKHDIFNVKHGS